MAGKNTAAFGIFRDREGAENAVESLKEHGFRNTDISVLFPENRGTKDFAIEKATKAPEGATTGAGSGAVVGGVLGWLAGIGALAIPGLGPLIAAGPIVAALAGVGAGGAVGALSGALIGMGIPEFEAKRYEGRVKEGGILLSVHCDDSNWTKKAKRILENAGAEDVSSTGEASADYDISDRPLPRSRSAADDPTAENVRTTNERDYVPAVPATPVPRPPSVERARIVEPVSTAPISDSKPLVETRSDRDTTEVGDVLDDLIKSCRDAENGFQRAAENVKDAELAAFFREQSVQRSGFANELEAQAQRFGNTEPRRKGSVGGAMHRAWLDLKEKVGGGDRSILDSVEQGEDSAKRTYQDALSQNLPEDLRVVVQRQADAVVSAHDRVKLLRDARRAA